MPRRARLALSGACIGVLLLVVLWYAAFHIGAVRQADATILNGFLGLDGPRIDGVANFVAGLCDPKPYVILASLPVLVAFLRGRPRVAVTIALILLCANETTELLKPLLAAHRDATSMPVDAASWPSGHATAAMSLCMCWVIAVSARWRPAVGAVMAAFAVAVSYSFLTLGWHYPSDVLGGFLVAAVWALVWIAALSIYEYRRRFAVSESPVQFTLSQALGPPAALAFGALVLVAVTMVAHPHAVTDYAQAHMAFVVGAAAIAALGFFLVSGVMLMLRVPGGRGRAAAPTFEGELPRRPAPQR
jgi:membrane-associated phospholipid phosphatase